MQQEAEFAGVHEEQRILQSTGTASMSSDGPSGETIIPMGASGLDVTSARPFSIFAVAGSCVVTPLAVTSSQEDLTVIHDCPADTDETTERRETLKHSAQVGSFPPVPASLGKTKFQFDPNYCSSRLDVAAPNCLRCATNATRFSQGVCFLEPAVQRGECAEVRISLDNKPGRMRYFVGVARKRFGIDGSDAVLRGAGWSLENLFSGPHHEGHPCRSTAPPLFHTGSIMTVVVDLRERAVSEVAFSVDSTGANFRVQLSGKQPESLFFWVSLYNRFAQCSILDP